MTEPVNNVGFRGRIEQGLSFIAPATLALGPTFLVRRHGHTAPVIWLEIAIGLIAVYVLMSNAWLKTQWSPLPLLIGLAPLLAILVIHRQQLDRSIITFLHLVLGMSGGWAMACLWQRRGLSSWTAADSGLAVAGLATTLQLALVLRKYSPLDFHEHAILSWGGSNYVAVVIAIIALMVWGRMRACRLPAGLLAVPAVMLLGILATLSRVGVVAVVGAVGVYLVLGMRRDPRQRRLLPLTVATVVCVAVIGVIGLSLLRTQHSSVGSVEGTVVVRVTMWRLAGEAFIQSPLVGTGLGALREVASRQFDPITSTFAHNLELSMLQQAGLFALPYLWIVAAAIYFGLRRNDTVGLQLGLLTVLAASQIEPLFEDTIGGFFSWTVLFAASSGLSDLFRRLRERASRRASPAAGAS